MMPGSIFGEETPMLGPARGVKIGKVELALLLYVGGRVWLVVWALLSGRFWSQQPVTTAGGSRNSRGPPSPSVCCLLPVQWLTRCCTWVR